MVAWQGSFFVTQGSSILPGRRKAEERAGERESSLSYKSATPSSCPLGPAFPSLTLIIYADDNRVPEWVGFLFPIAPATGRRQPHEVRDRLEVLHRRREREGSSRPQACGIRRHETSCIRVVYYSTIGRMRTVHTNTGLGCAKARNIIVIMLVHNTIVLITDTLVHLCTV